MERRIAAFSEDEAGTPVAVLDCFHRQPLRPGPHQPGEVGAPLDCAPCDRAELPAGLAVVRSTGGLDEQTMPAGLRRAHRVASRTWGRLRVDDGRLRFRARTHPPIDVIVEAGRPQAIPPEVEHDVEPLGAVRFVVEFLRPPAGGPPGPAVTPR